MTYFLLFPLCNPANWIHDTINGFKDGVSDSGEIKSVMRYDEQCKEKSVAPAVASKLLLYQVDQYLPHYLQDELRSCWILYNEAGSTTPGYL